MFPDCAHPQNRGLGAAERSPRLVFPFSSRTQEDRSGLNYVKEGREELQHLNDRAELVVSVAVLSLGQGYRASPPPRSFAASAGVHLFLARMSARSPSKDSARPSFKWILMH